MGLERGKNAPHLHPSDSLTIFEQNTTMALMKITQNLEKREVGDKLVTVRVERAYAFGIKVWEIEKIVDTERIRRTTS